ncbi:AI-2E family transporter [Actinophytocola sp.]|uniref:AI-2E family transporter n=1 Tax=Actinophytocola sp. TaxID=1872138 RepID=UPI002D80815F|nr:AI-2E family transporter [Actinophytocola sp.]HET9138995.1 AI-2E family transporter [Actinophytocola sp.]
MTSEPVPAEPVDRPGGAVPRGLIVLLGLSAAVIVAAGIWAAGWLIGPVFLALTIVIAVSPLQSWLLRKGIPRWAATGALIVVIYAMLLSLFLVMVVSVARLADVLPEYADRARELVNDAVAAMARFGVEPDDVATVANSMDPGKLVGLVSSILSAMGTIVSSIIFLFSLLLFLSFESNSAGRRLKIIAEDRPRVAVALGEFARGTRSYLIVSTVFGLVVAVLDTIGLALLGIPLPVLWGLLAFITNYIPNVGFIIGLLPPALLGLLEGGWGKMLAVVVVYGGLNFVVQSLIQPRFVGNAVGLSSTVSFLALLFWAWLIGPLGAILAIPLTLLAKALLVDVDPEARWADALLGVQRPPARPKKTKLPRQRRHPTLRKKAPATTESG